MAAWCELKVRDDDAFRLRELLTQTASPGSFQSRMIQTIDVAIEDSKRDRFAGARRPRSRFLEKPGHHVVRVSAHEGRQRQGCGCLENDPLCAVWNVNGRCLGPTHGGF